MTFDEYQKLDDVSKFELRIEQARALASASDYTPVWTEAVADSVQRKGSPISRFDLKIDTDYRHLAFVGRHATRLSIRFAQTAV